MPLSAKPSTPYALRKNLFLNNSPLEDKTLSTLVHDDDITDTSHSSKMSFNTQPEATAAATVLRSTDNISLKAYFCSSCSVWHLTSG
jgi:hypothetical protein